MKCSKVDERTKCYECEETFAFNEKGACVVNEDKSCLIEKEGACMKCKYYMEEPYKCSDRELLKTSLKGEVINGTTDNDNIINEDSTIENNESSNDLDQHSYKERCNMFSKIGCMRCQPGYYADGMYCKKCREECNTCYDGNTCSTCFEGYAPLNGECVEIEKVSPNCHKILPNGAGCAQCNDGYYRNSTECVECPEGCSTCMDNKLCFGCKDNYYMTAYMSICKHQNNLGKMCLNKTKSGCQKCGEGYYLESV